MVDDEGRPSSRAASPAAITEPAPANPELALTARDSSAELGETIQLPAPGYQVGAVIGSGGMGEVLAAHDQRIGREVALKRLRGEHPDGSAITRFLREARIQARLDHPAIVPVHDLGTDTRGRPYFTMKRLKGTTLAQQLEDGTPQNRLLRAFIEVCQAVDFAHARGVVHRDLKPSNIMLGDYGEVYVLDWGVARVLAERTSMASVPSDSDTLEDHTQTGALLGTPGYMAPEQIKAVPATAAADVYALGAILFEILVRTPLHPRGPTAITHTLTNPQETPSKRKREAQIPPELDVACHDALFEDPAARPTARQLADRVQAYLDGDRDVERRRLLAAAQLASARTAMGVNDRATAMQSAGRALALDPESAAAAELVTKLIIEPPEQLPAELVDQLERAEQAFTRARITKAVFAFSSPFVLLLLIPWLHVKSWTWLLAFYAALAVTGAISLWMGLVRGRTNVVFMLISTLTVSVLWSRLAGPLMLTPALICGVMVALASHPQMVPRPAVLLGWGVVAVALPFVLEGLDVIPTSLQQVETGLLTTSTIFGPGDNEHLALIFVNLVFVMVVGLFASQLGRMAAAAQHKLRVQAWHLGKLLPTR